MALLIISLGVWATFESSFMLTNVVIDDQSGIHFQCAKDITKPLTYGLSCNFPSAHSIQFHNYDSKVKIPMENVESRWFSGLFRVFWFEIQLICFDRACVGPAREQQQNQNKRSELNVKFLDHWKTLLNPIFLWNQTNFQASANGTGLKEVT